MKISATEFKAKCLKLIDEVAQTHEPLVVTKRGKPVAKVVPIEPEADQEPSYFGCMAGTIEIVGDIIEPIEQEWAAMTGEEDEFYQDLGVAEDKPESSK